MKLTIHLSDYPTDDILTLLATRDRDFPESLIRQSIEHHKAGDLRYNRNSGVTRDNRLGHLASWVHRQDTEEIRDTYSESDIIIWLFGPEIFNSCSRATRGLDM